MKRIISLLISFDRGFYKAIRGNRIAQSTRFISRSLVLPFRPSKPVTMIREKRDIFPFIKIKEGYIKPEFLVAFLTFGESEANSCSFKMRFVRCDYSIF